MTKKQIDNYVIISITKVNNSNRKEIISLLPNLNEDDWKNQDYDFWKKYREEFTSMINEQNKKKKKSPENIYKMAKKIGIKPTARYFEIEPSQVRYYVKKYEIDKKDL